jgi:tRNA A-37 threonylcarbamoyl transferase component Bud32
VSGDNYDRVKEIFLQACDLDLKGREQLLDRECAGDADLRARVESLLAHHWSQTILDSRAVEPARAKTGAHSSLWDRMGRAADLMIEEVRARKGTYLAAALVLVALIAGGIWSHYGIESAMRQILRDQLQTVLDADITALELWLEEQKADAEHWAEQPDVREQIQELVRLSRSDLSPAATRQTLLDSTAMAELRESLQVYLDDDETHHTAYAITDRSGLVLGAPENTEVGIHLNSTGMADIAYAFAGETRISKPHPEGSFAADRPIHRENPMIWVGTPVYDTSGNIIAALSLGVSADYQFTRILSVARMGRTGETYAFDEKGWLISDSRFTDQLKALGLIPNEPGARAVFNMQVRDPGVDLTTGAKAALPQAAQPLTKLAAMAIARQDGTDSTGYRDYRGVLTIGAWRWLPEYGFGIGTEVDYAEAYAPLRYPLVASWLPLGVLIVAAGGFLYSAFHIAGLQRQIGVARQVGQYTLEQKIGEGGMGVVYRARHSMLRRRTAVKLLKPELMTPVAIARFEREVQLASQLTHPNTIEIYDFGRTTDGVFYYAMEYLPGASLAQLIQIEGAVSPGRSVYILKQICGSLAEAHNIGLAHRDVKPHNIMLCERGGQADFIKVLDFGLVKSTAKSEDTGLTAATAMAGTPLYMAPERLRDPLVTDTRSDLYSIGAVAYDLLTGRNIFHCASDLDVLFHVMNVMPEAPSQLNPAVPALLSDLVMSCLSKDPLQRPQSASEILEVLDKLTNVIPWTQTDARRWWQEHGAAILDLQRRSLADTVEFVAHPTVAPTSTV